MSGLGDEAGEIEDHREDVVEIVGDATGQLTEGFEAPALQQPRLRKVTVRPRMGLSGVDHQLEPVLGQTDVDAFLGSFPVHPLLQAVLSLPGLQLLLAVVLD